MKSTSAISRLLLFIFLSSGLLAVASCKGNSSKPYFALPPAASSTTASSAVISITAIGADGQVTVSWNGIDDATSYEVYRSLVSGSTGTLAATIPAPTVYYIDSGLANGISCFYTVIARNGSSTIATSGQVFATPYIPGALIMISGSIKYQDKIYDENRFTGSQPFKPVRYADVELVSASGILTAATDSNGLFSFGAISASASAVYVRVSSAATLPGGSTSQVMVKNRSGSLYSVASANFVPTGSASVNLLVTTGSIGGAFNILDVFTNGFELVHELAGYYPASLTGYWQKNSADGTYYCPINGGCGNEGIYILNASNDTDEYDDDVLYHEFGHFAAAHFSKDDSRGGMHRLSDNDLDMRLTWSEGWGNFFTGAVKSWLSSKEPGRISSVDPQLSSYVDTYGSSAMYVDFGNPGGWPYYHSTNETAVAKVLWRVLKASFVSPRGMSAIWTVITSNSFTSPVGPVNLELFWDVWLATWPEDELVLSPIFSERQIDYFDDGYATIPDSTFGTVIPYTGSAQIHTLYGAGDLDTISFTATTNQSYAILTSNLLNGADTVLTLYNSDGLLVNDNWNPNASYAGRTPSYVTASLCESISAGPCHENGDVYGFSVLGSKVTFQAGAAAGTYYVQVKSSSERPLSAGRYGTYTLTITPTP